jgi:uncharacterized membrane protein (UPF0127 family)
MARQANKGPSRTRRTSQSKRRAFCSRAVPGAALMVVASSLFIGPTAARALASSSPSSDAVLTAGSHRYILQLAVTSAQQARGLGYRARPPVSSGMLFVFPLSGTRCFWMKGMRFALDIIWLSPSDKVVTVHRDLLPKDPSIYCAVAQDVVELDAGQAHAAGIDAGLVVGLEVPAA